jgi:sterol desaturase/sphingolipid hydroxylase (fatty acid hydroxylase superfamily)
MSESPSRNIAMRAPASALAISDRTRDTLSRVLYPVLLGLPLGAFALLWKTAGWDPNLTIMAVYWAYFLVLVGVERLLPFEPAWNRRDGQLKNDLILSALGLPASTLAAIASLWLLTWAIKTFEPLLSLNVWPVHWPFAVQLVLGVLLWDLGNNLAHRWAHKVPFMWRFHVVHHAAPRLTVVNTGRFHPFDLAKSVIIGAPIPFLLGVPDEIAWWYAAFNAFTGILTHANIHLQCGIFNEFWSTPNTHRLHHSPDVRETDTHYGEVTMIWDRLLGSYLKPTGVTPRNVGLGADCLVSTRLWDTLIHPLTLRGHRAPVERRIANLEPGQAGLPIAGHE